MAMPKHLGEGRSQFKIEHAMMVVWMTDTLESPGLKAMLPSIAIHTETLDSYALATATPNNTT